MIKEDDLERQDEEVERGFEIEDMIVSNFRETKETKESEEG